MATKKAGTKKKVTKKTPARRAGEVIGRAGNGAGNIALGIGSWYGNHPIRNTLGAAAIAGLGLGGFPSCSSDASFTGRDNVVWEDKKAGDDSNYLTYSETQGFWFGGGDNILKENYRKSGRGDFHSLEVENGEDMDFRTDWEPDKEEVSVIRGRKDGRDYTITRNEDGTYDFKHEGAYPISGIEAESMLGKKAKGLFESFDARYQNRTQGVYDAVINENTEFIDEIEKESKKKPDM